VKRKKRKTANLDLVIAVKGTEGGKKEGKEANLGGCCCIF